MQAKEYTLNSKLLLLQWFRENWWLEETVNTAVIIIIFKSLTDNYCHIITYHKSLRAGISEEEVNRDLQGEWHF